MERVPASGEIYRHFKNRLYQIVTVAEHTETGEKLVIYQALYGTYQIYARPLAMFLSEVDHVKYPKVTQKYRFEKITPGELPAEEEKPETVPKERSVSNGNFVKPQRIEEDEPEVNPKLMQFLDTDDYEEKYNILISMQDEIDDNMLNAMGLSMDVILPDGDLYDRFEALKYSVRTRQRYESIRLR